MNLPRALRDYKDGEPKETRQLRSKNEIYNELLALRCRQGRKDALEKLVRIWERPLCCCLRRLIDGEQEARQVLQETWIKVLPGQFKSQEKLLEIEYRLAELAEKIGGEP